MTESSKNNNNINNTISSSPAERKSDDLLSNFLSAFLILSGSIITCVGCYDIWIVMTDECVPGDCSWREAPERTPLTILLVNMLLLYLLGLVVLIFKIFAKPIVNGPKEDSVSAKNYGLSSSLKVNNSSGRTSLRQRSSTPPHQREALDTMV
eukprot:scaffold2913_cov181-Ochromonas_danica.AAC.5